jgi:hypothetical protein
VTPEMIAELKKEFGKTAVGKLPKVTCKTCSDPKLKCDQHARRYCKICKGVVSEAHIHVDFVGHAYVTERLWAVDPEWSWEPLAFNQSGLPAMDEFGGLWIKLTIGGQTRLGYGDADGRKGHNATKIAIGDAIRNAAMRFQVALDMWKKDKQADEKTAAVTEDQPTAPLSREELLRQVKVLGRTKHMDFPKLADDFALWSKGEHDLKDAAIAVLIEYRNHLQGGES